MEVEIEHPFILNYLYFINVKKQDGVDGLEIFLKKSKEEEK